MKISFSRQGRVTKQILDNLSMCIPQSKIREKHGERLTELVDEKSCSVNYRVVKLILESLKREE